MTSLKDVLQGIFGEEPVLTEENSVIYGQGKIENQLFHILGVKESTFLGVQQALTMAEKVITILESQSKAPVLLLVDVAGQQLTMRDEWLGMQQYFAHLLACLHCLREQGNRLISLVYNQAVGGGFIAYGLMADTVLALPKTDLAVMWLEGIAKVTKIDLAKLKELSVTLPVFAPGADNFYKMGGLHEIIALADVAKKLLTEATLHNSDDMRAKLGFERGGRKLSLPVLNEINALL